MSQKENVCEELSEAVKEQIEKNRLKALAIRQSRLVAHPYAKGAAVAVDNSKIKIGSIVYKDTGGGFLLEETPENPESQGPIVTDEPPILESDRPDCINCKKPFAVSWLFDNYNYKCCDECNNPEVHKLITKTEAMNEYLLKDCDLDKREPVLKYITRKNPHHVSWGEMKLYLQVQVEERALEVWGSEENIEEERERREERKVVAKVKKYNKQLKQLRMSMRSSLYDRTSGGSHVHEYGPELYNEDDDTYSRTCTTCSFKETYEKM